MVVRRWNCYHSHYGKSASNIRRHVSNQQGNSVQVAASLFVLSGGGNGDSSSDAHPAEAATHIVVLSLRKKNSGGWFMEGNSDKSADLNGVKSTVMCFTDLLHSPSFPCVNAIF